MRMATKIVVILSTCLLLNGCKKDPEPISNTPLITFVAISPTSVKQFKDQITITISYKDGDGDIGENNTDKKNLFVTDSRNAVAYQYRIQQLAPSGSTIAIEGNLKVVIPNTALTDNSSSQSVTYTIYLVDRAGHQSNSVSSTAVTVTN